MYKSLGERRSLISHSSLRTKNIFNSTFFILFQALDVRSGAPSEWHKRIKWRETRLMRNIIIEI